jgi:hypothetical protein
MIYLQRVPERIGYYLAGFTDGEGSFNVSFRPREDYQIPWKVSLCFNISQKDKVILALCKRYFQCGTLRSRPDGVWYFEVNNFSAIIENIIPFFRKYGFLSAKKKNDFEKFRQVAELVKQNQHLTSDGIKKIMQIRNTMNDGGNRKYTDEEILQGISAGESSETTRQTDIFSKSDDIVRSA